LFTDPKTRKYLTGANVDEGYLVLSDKAIIFTDARYYSGVKVDFERLGVEVKLLKGFDDVKEYLLQLGAEKLFIDYDKTSVSEYLKYKETGLEVLDCAKLLQEVRAVKSDSEIESIKKACEITEKAFYSAIKTLKVGITEIELKNTLEENMLSLGGEGIAFSTIVAFGENGAVPHHETGKTVLTENTSVLVDMGCTVNGYCSDITRTVFFGNPDKKFKDCYQAVLKANLTAIENITCGTACNLADKLARDQLESAGLKDYFTHSLGHGVGLDIHEFPTLSPKSSAVLSNSMVFTIEPGVYLDGEFGIRIEDTVILKDGKVERLYSDDKNLIVIK
jgi:Xaa-Pro aminopeptidase